MSVLLKKKCHKIDRYIFVSFSDTKVKMKVAVWLAGWLSVPLNQKCKKPELTVYSLDFLKLQITLNV